MDDKTYEAFLEAANEPRNTHPQPKAALPSKLMQSANFPSKELHTKLSKAVEGITYTSESDEDFHPIFLTTLPKALVEIPRDQFDAANNYEAVVEAVKQAARTAEIHFYEAVDTNTKTIYYVLAKVNDGWVGFSTMGVFT
ncbi:hypothetical protein SJAG_01316 [Schizosaccharomyces japonicus yFS275]|uniref:Uncharacterized protein n=1 Tax=Schizosaccharomyces japonicus (strain yFS275 / FY16936) TaxID=402676 RepID=B6K0C2_SCHJY|nr:hypothetical protein SJAG_01316 [Schizosaccharomyces japonicus yFS275]EEB06272.1 hypothetical protein SJAG_01316 [Schizosaccharomyces japonicus yFS275]